MTVGQVAHAAGQAAGGHKPEVPDAESRAVARDFGRTLRERAALTDPQIDKAARASGAAPLATAFDRGDPFGRSVAWGHDLAVPPSSEAAPEPAAPAAAPAAASADALGGEQAALLDDPEAALGARDTRPSARTAAGLTEAAPDLSAGRPREAGDAQVPVGPAMAERAPQGRSRAVAASAPRQDARRGEWLRRQVVAQLAPVHVVARAAAQGVRVTARIGAAGASEAAEIEQALAAAVRDEGGELAELRLDGRMQRSERCR